MKRISGGMLGRETDLLDYMFDIPACAKLDLITGEMCLRDGEITWRIDYRDGPLTDISSEQISVLHKNPVFFGLDLARGFSESLALKVDDEINIINLSPDWQQP